MNMIKCALQIQYKLNITSEESQLVGGWPVGYLQGVEELNSGPPKTNPCNGREEDLNSGPPDYKSSARPLGHPRLSKPEELVEAIKRMNPGEVANILFSKEVLT